MSGKDEDIICGDFGENYMGINKYIIKIYAFHTSRT